MLTLSAASRALGCPRVATRPLWLALPLWRQRLHLSGGCSFPQKAMLFGDPSGGSPNPLTITKKGEKMENRKRNITLSIRLTAEEKEALKKKAEQANLSLTDYLLRCSSRKKIRVINMSKVIVEMKRVGNNLNQITRKINSGDFKSYNFEKVIEEQRKIYDLLLSVMSDS